MAACQLPVKDEESANRRSWPNTVFGLCRDLELPLGTGASVMTPRNVGFTNEVSFLLSAGLDEAILGSMNSCGDPEQDSKKIADLLKYGAHSLVSAHNRGTFCMRTSLVAYKGRRLASHGQQWHVAQPVMLA